MNSKLIKYYLVSILLIPFSYQSNAQVNIISFGAEWNYYDLGQDPPNQNGDSTAWIDLNYNDTSWLSGPAQLGYGDNDEATELSDTTETAYFRHVFNLPDTPVYNSLKLNLIYDDGAVVYLNGIEIWRVNMPAGPIDYSTFASSNSGDDALASTTIDTSYLVDGPNILAVEIHQRSASSSDLSFDFELNTQLEFIPFGSEWKYYDLAQLPPNQNGDSTTWFDVAYHDSIWQSGHAQLGYGDNDEMTIISDTARTAYFRHTFMRPDLPVFNYLDMNLIYDDGAVVYLNGSEIRRVNMPSGPIDYATFASSNSGDNATRNIIIDTTDLLPGANLLAVEIHQQSSTSTDLSFDLELEPLDGGEVNLIRGPYLQMGRPDGMVIKWRTSHPAYSIINYDTSLDSLNYTIGDSILKFDHEITIDNLLPNTKYYYQIQSQQGVLVNKAADLYFKTSPAHGTSQLVRAWILGDPGTANSNARNVRNAYYNYVDSLHTDMILFLGDNAYNDGTDEQYQYAVFENMYEDKLKNTVAWSTLGNHDGHSADSETQTGPYYEIFSLPKNAESGGMASGTEAYYSFDYANVHFIILDSYDSDRSIGGPMYNWCLTDLQNTTAEWIVAFWHHPAYTKGSHNSDTEGALIAMRTNFLPLLEMYGTDIVLSGHSHSYERSYFIHGHYDISDSFDVVENTIDGIGIGDGRPDGDGAYIKTFCQDEGAVYITTGSAGKTGGGTFDHEAMFISVSELGSCVMEIEEHEINFKFLRETGVVRDSFTIIKSDCDTTPITICSTISSSYGDVEELADSSIYQQSSDLELVRDNQNGLQTVGLVFSDVQTRRGSWIQSATIQFTADDDAGDVSSDSSYLVIRGFAADDANIFSETLNDVTNRVTTTAQVIWNPDPWVVPGERTTLQLTPDLAGIIQEIVNRQGYNVNSNIGFSISGFGKRSALSYDHGDISATPELCITYTSCFDTLQADVPPAIKPAYAAEDIVRSSAYFQNGPPLYFTAGKGILLDPNFELELGREFLADIQGCILR